MKVEVYKLYDNHVKLLDTISTPTVSYLAKGFQPDGKFNSGNTDTLGNTIENKFDSKGSEYNFGSTIKNIVLDYAGPEFVHDYSKYTSFKEDGVAKINIKLEVTDALGIDCDKFQIGFFYGTKDEKILYESKHIFSKDDVNEGDINWDSQFNYNYDGPLAEIINAEGPDFVTANGDGFVYHKGAIENYVIDFNLNFTGDSTEGALGLAYQDLKDGIYQTFTELNAGNMFVKLWDLAGNEYVFTGLKPLMVIPWTFEELEDYLDPLELYFYDTYPANMLLLQDVIGQSNIVVKNTNKTITEKYGFETVLKLEPDTVGYLVDMSRKIEDFDLYEEVDGIDSVGYVKAYAFLYTDKFDYQTIQMIKQTTYAKGTLGPWIRECEDNIRKIEADRYVPDFAQGSKFHEFVNFLCQFLNTAWCPLDKDCRIGLLEKISRIGDFNDIDKIEFPAVQYWSDDRGNELEFDKAAIDAIKGMSKKYSNLDMDGYDCIRYLYKNLPYINMYKGTIDCFKIIFNSLGINAELIPLWSKNEGEGSTDWQCEYFYDKDKNNPEAWNKYITDEYYLSSHLELKVHGYLAYDLIDIASSIVKLAKSVLPVVRVIEHLLVEEFSQSSNCLALGFTDNTHTFEDTENCLQCISFLWNCNDWKFNIRNGEIEIRVPQIALRCTNDGAEWWKGFNANGVVNNPTNNNNRTRNVAKFFNMMGRTLKNSDLYMFVDYSNKKGELPDTDYFKSLVALSYNKLEIADVNWDSGYMVLKAKNNSFDGIARLNTADYIQVTFVFNRVSHLCYTTDIKTALSEPTIDAGVVSLPGYKPFTWPRYKKEVI